MQPLFQALDVASASAAGALLSAVWQGALLVLAIALCLRLLPGATATLRSLIWSAVLLIAAALPIRPLLTSTSAISPGSTHGVHVDSRWALALVSLWAALTLARLVALARSAIRLHQIARRATPVHVDPALLPLLHRGHGKVQLCVSDEVDRPCVLGFLSPRILLPPELLESLQAPELTHIVLHEMEHLRRGDHWLNLFQKLLLALSPLNPVLLWVERRLCLERELACDDGVLRFTRARKVYATCLTNLAEHAMVRRSLSLALGAWEKQSELTRRVQRILTLPELAITRSRSRLRAAALTSTLLAVLTGGAAFLAESPQLVTFSPDLAPQTVAVAGPVVTPAHTGNVSLSPQLHPAQSVRAAYVETAMKLDPTSRPSRIPVAKHRAYPLMLRTHARPNPARSGSWVTLTSYRTSRSTAPFVVTNVSDPNISYAAVPWLNGWLLVQL